ncbi:MAG: hypothetical protein ACOX69_11355 [Coriobacteriales bacterium]|jgi:2,4-dienoyl-CoA reductase-like NADH-dependent reductase (Old Yellow Enzyme family)
MALDTLFSPIDIGKLHLDNRIVVSAMVTRYCEETGLPGEMWNCYYERKARGGWGLVFTENYGIVHEANCFKRQAGLWDDSMIEAHKNFVDRVHAAGGLIGCQIYHGGREVPSSISGVQPVGPSPIREPSCKDTPRELTVPEIERIVELFGDTARRAQQCGFDIIEFNGAHGYLLNEFYSPFANKRTDEYGGSLENRMRFPLEVIANTREKVGPDLPISFRLSTCDYVEGGITTEESPTIAHMLEEAGVDMINCSQGMYVSKDAIVPPASVEPGAFVENAAAVKKAVSIPVVATGRINDPVLAEEILASGKADLVTMARASLADPDLPLKAKAGRLDEIVKCTGCCELCTGPKVGGNPIGCVLNPEVGKEYLSAGA